MKSCFDDYITLGEISPSVTPRSGLHVTDLPGISINQFEALVNGEADVEEFWNNLYKRAKTTFLTEILTKLNNTFNVENIINASYSGVFDPARIINEVEGEAGVTIEFIKSKYSVVEIQTIKIWSVTDVENAIIEIIDAESDAILKTIETNLTGGEFNSIDVFEQYTSESIKVIYDPTQVQSIETTNSKPRKGCCTSCTRNVEQINGGGLVVEYLTACSLELFVCSRISMFKMPFWWWLGVELMKERAVSENTNCFTIDIKEAERLLDIYETEFNKSIDPLMKNLKVKDDHVCFDCKGTIAKKTILP